MLLLAELVVYGLKKSYYTVDQKQMSNDVSLRSGSLPFKKIRPQGVIHLAVDGFFVKLFQTIAIWK